MAISLRVKDSEKLKKMIALNGDSYRTYADRIGVSYGYLSLIINQQVQPSPITAKKVATGIGKNVKDIFFATDVRKSETKQVEGRT